VPEYGGLDDEGNGFSGFGRYQGPSKKDRYVALEEQLKVLPDRASCRSSRTIKDSLKYETMGTSVCRITTAGVRGRGQDARGQAARHRAKRVTARAPGTRRRHQGTAPRHRAAQTPEPPAPSAAVMRLRHPTAARIYVAQLGGHGRRHPSGPCTRLHTGPLLHPPRHTRDPPDVQRRRRPSASSRADQVQRHANRTRCGRMRRARREGEREGRLGSSRAVRGRKLSKKERLPHIAAEDVEENHLPRDLQGGTLRTRRRRPRRRRNSRLTGFAIVHRLAPPYSHGIPRDLENFSGGRTMAPVGVAARWNPEQPRVRREPPPSAPPGESAPSRAKEALQVRFEGNRRCPRRDEKITPGSTSRVSHYTSRTRVNPPK